MKYSFYFLFLVASFSIFSSCGGDDDAITPLVYTICDADLNFSAADKSDVSTLSIDQVPQNIRSYVASSFAGYSINTASSFAVEGIAYFEVIANNSGKLLFDKEGNFVCGDDSFANNNGEDEYLEPGDLPQAILDYINQNYPNATIDEAELEDGGYKIDFVDNKDELCFDLQGNFLGKC